MKKIVFFREKKIDICFLIISLLTIIIPVVTSITTKYPITLGVVISAILFLFTILIWSIVALVEYLKETIYSYRNIALIALILYLPVQIISLLVYYYSCLSSGNGFELFGLLTNLIELPQKFSIIAIPIIIIIGIPICVSNISLIRHEGFRTKNMLGIILSLAYIISSIGLYYLFNMTKNAVDSGTYIFLHTFVQMFVLMILCYFECIFFASLIMGYVAAKRVPKYDKDFIIVLGCSISKSGGLLPLLKGRTNRAVKFAWEQEIATGKKVLFVPSGGQGKDEIMSEGSAMELYLLSHGAEIDEVFPERKSTNTYENIKYSKEIIDSIKKDAKIAFATTNYHVLRSGIIARKAGVDAEGIASKTKWYFWPNGFVREYIGILAMNIHIHYFASLFFFIACFVLAIITNFLL